MQRVRLLESWPEVREEAVDTDSKMMATFHEHGQGFREAVKSAPEPVLQACSRIMSGGDVEALTPAAREQRLARNTGLAEQGLRVLAVATREPRSSDAAPY